MNYRYNDYRPANHAVKKPRIPVIMKMIRWTYPKVERLAPSYAHQWFVSMFFTPLRYQVPAHEKQLSLKARKTILKVSDKKLQVYSWGEGPVVLFVHGWAGRGTQFGHFVEPFTNAGLQVVAIDAPAHGLSEGKTTSIFEFKDSIFAISKHIGGIHAIVAHSLGGTASLFSLAEGLSVKRLVTIATPTLGDEIINEFANRLQGSEGSKKFLRHYIHQKFNRSFDSLMASEFARQLSSEIDMLIIHDEHDREVSLKNAHHLLDAYPKATLKKTSGLGHVRILKDKNVIEECLRFAKS